MHRSTRILLCRIGFLLLCVLPTIVVAGWIVSRGAGGYSAAQTAEWERELTSRLGLIVEIGDVSYPSSQVARLHDFKLLAPETRKSIAETAQIEIAKTADSWTVDAALLSIEADELPSLAHILNERLLREQTPLHVRWLPRDVLLRGDEQSQTLTQVKGAFERTTEASSFDLVFPPPGHSAGSEPIRLYASRQRNQPQPVTTWSVDSASHSLPCSLLDAVAPDLARLGKDCEFRGKLHFIQSREDTSGDLAGMLANIDLDTLVTEHFPHQLSGLASLTIERAALENGKLVEVRGSMQAPEGALSSSLIAAAQEHLGLEISTELVGNPPAAAIPFQNLTIGFRLSGQSLCLTEGVLIASGEGPIVTAPPNHSSTGVNLLRMLLPDSQYQVPATRQTSALVRLLPLPDLAHAPRSPQTHTPTRLAPAPSALPAAIRQPVLR